MLRNTLGGLFAKHPGVEDHDPAEAWPHQISIQVEKHLFEVLFSVSHYSDSEHWISFDDVGMERPLDKYMANDPFPLPQTRDREGYYGDRHLDYWLSGLRDYLRINQVLTHYAMDLDHTAKVFDLGCASGRVLRHFVSQSPEVDVWGADINNRHIEWILRFLGPLPKVFQNTVLPNLPLEDNSMSAVFAFSVFTHIDEFELAWLAEVRRILKPGGVAYMTIHSDHTWSVLGPQHAVYNDLLEHSSFISEYDVTPEFLAGPMPSDRTVFKWPTITSVYNCSLFHSAEYITNVWGRFFEVMEIISEASGVQDVVVLRKET